MVNFILQEIFNFLSNISPLNSTRFLEPFLTFSITLFNCSAPKYDVSMFASSSTKYLLLKQPMGNRDRYKQCYAYILNKGCNNSLNTVKRRPMIRYEILNSPLLQNSLRFWVNRIPSSLMFR